MSALHSILVVVIVIVLVVVASMRPSRSSMSLFELRRRTKNGDTKAARQLEREETATDIWTILQIVTAFLLVAVVLLSVMWFGWMVGAIVAVIIVLEYGALARLRPVHRVAQTFYEACEPYLMRFVQASGGVVRFIRFQSDDERPLRVDSKEELVMLIESSGGVLAPHERRRLVSGLAFGDKKVAEVMTPRSVVDVVAADELLGPLILDDLYKTGHSRMPVIEGDIDHVVGILYIQNLLTASAKKTLTAAQAMESNVFYIHEDQTIQHAMNAFLKTHHHLFIVVNEYRETVGVISLEDVIEELLGQEIIDEFDFHDDLRKVAARKKIENNTPKHHVDV